MQTRCNMVITALRGIITQVLRFWPGIKQFVGDKVQVNYAKGCDLWSAMDKSGFNEAVSTANKS